MTEYFGPVGKSIQRWQCRCDEMAADLTYLKNAAYRGAIDREKLNETDKEYNRESWGLLAAVFNAYAARDNWATPGTPLSAPRLQQPREPLPALLAKTIAIYLDELAGGVVPPAFKRAGKAGSKSKVAMRRQFRQFAVAYIRAAQDGIVDDPAAFENVRRAYSDAVDPRDWISDRSIYDWLEEFPNMTIEILFPGASLVSDFAGRMKQQLADYGKGYLNHGLSVPSRVKRARKRN